MCATIGVSNFSSLTVNQRNLSGGGFPFPPGSVSCRGGGGFFKLNFKVTSEITCRWIGERYIVALVFLVNIATFLDPGIPGWHFLSRIGTGGNLLPSSLASFFATDLCAMSPALFLGKCHTENMGDDKGKRRRRARECWDGGIRILFFPVVLYTGGLYI